MIVSVEKSVWAQMIIIFTVLKCVNQIPIVTVMRPV